MKTRKFWAKARPGYPAVELEVPIALSGRDKQGRALDPREDVYLMGIKRSLHTVTISPVIRNVPANLVTEPTNLVTDPDAGLCKHCGNPLPLKAGPGRQSVFCSTSCKQAAYRKMKQKEG